MKHRRRFGTGWWRPNGKAPNFGAPVGGTRGPELCTAAFTAWTRSGTGVSADASGITFANAQGAIAHLDGLATEDGATYEVIFTVEGYSAGNVVMRVYGKTATHTGVGATVSANGTYTQQVTTSGAGSPVSQVRFTPNTGASMKITACSCKKVLA